jgi:uncharacterized protein (TIGR00661 family)
MSKILYSLCGDGRGHATRVRTIVEALRPNNEIVIYAPWDAYDLLAPVYEGTDVDVRRIPCLHLLYNSRHKIHYWKTIWHGLSYLYQAPSLIRKLQEEIEREQPDLIITDHEPLLPRAVERYDVPHISLNHQHFLVACDLSSLPAYLRHHTILMRKVVNMYTKNQDETIISSFYFPPLKPGYENCTQIGVLLRPEIIQAQIERKDHVIVYLRRYATPSVLNALQECGCEARIYGLGALPSTGSLRFFDVDPYRFIEDLSTSRALVCTAGNQLVGEAFYLEKPVLAMPEHSNYEQHINAHFVRESKAGESADIKTLTGNQLKRFISRADDYRSHIDRFQQYGNPTALSVINKYLSQPSPVQTPPFFCPTQAEVRL